MRVQKDLKEGLSAPSPSVPGPCDPEDLIDGIIFAANYLGSTQLLSDKTPSKNIRMMQAQEAVSRIKVSAHNQPVCVCVCASDHTVLKSVDAPQLLSRHLLGFRFLFYFERRSLYTVFC